MYISFLSQKVHPLYLHGREVFIDKMLRVVR
jgi:hypothetical protein